MSTLLLLYYRHRHHHHFTSILHLLLLFIFILFSFLIYQGFEDTNAGRQGHDQTAGHGGVADAQNLVQAVLGSGRGGRKPPAEHGLEAGVDEHAGEAAGHGDERVWHLRAHLHLLVPRRNENEG